MALVNCEACGERVSTEAPTCPHCGADGPAKRSAAAVLTEARPGDHEGPGPAAGAPGTDGAQRPDVGQVRGLGLLWALIGIAIGKYFGLGLFLLLATVAGVAALLGTALGRVTRPSSRPLLPAVGLQLAQFVWIVAASAYLGTVRSMVPHAAVLLAGTLWLWLQPGSLVVGILSVYQGAAFVQQLLVYLALPPDFGEQASKAALGGVVAMTLVRLTAVILMVTGLTSARRQAAVRANLEVSLPEMLTWEEVRALVDQAEAGTLYQEWPSAQDERPEFDAARWDAVLRDVDFGTARRVLRRALGAVGVEGAPDPTGRVYTKEYALALARFMVEPCSETAARLLEASPAPQEMFEQSRPGGLWKS